MSSDEPAVEPTGDEDRGAVGGGPGLLAELKADPARLGLETLLLEIAKWSVSARSVCRTICSQKCRRSGFGRGVPGPALSIRRGCARIRRRRA